MTQLQQNLPQSTKLATTKLAAINLDVETETGTGKTYCYMKSMFELHRRNGWSKFVIVVPSTALREGWDNPTSSPTNPARTSSKASNPTSARTSPPAPAKPTRNTSPGKIVNEAEGNQTTLTTPMAKQIDFYLIQNGYRDIDGTITEAYHKAQAEGTIADLPTDLEPYTPSIIELIDAVYSDAAIPQIEDSRKAKMNPLNDNFDKKEFHNQSLDNPEDFIARASA